MRFRLVGYCICATMAAAGATAAEPVVGVTNIEDFSLEDLLSATTSIASSKSVQLRAAPGVVTIISRDEIRRLGARDLLEVLVMVPGFDIGTDVLGTFAASFRGNWGNEGKILFLVDGIEMNETAYMSVPLLNHFPLEDVERIEVLRGPGSARYGNAAELAVVQIITRTGAARHNASVELTGAQQRLPFENGSVALTGGTTVEALQGLDLTWNLHAGTRNTSDRAYTDVYGTAVELGGQNRANALWLNAAAQLPWMKLRLLVDGHESWDRTGYDDASVYDRAVKVAFPTVMVDAQFPIEAAPALSVTPRLTLQRGLPWWSFAEDGVQLEPSRLVADRARANVTTEWVPFAALTLRGGIEGTADSFRYVDQESQNWALDLVDTRFIGSDTVNYVNGAVFGEASVDTPIVTVTMGARGEVHSEAGPSFVPRVALTRVFDRGHLKAIVSGAFKAPARVNFEVAPGISPERTRVFEGEVGIQPLDELYVTLNAFDVDIKDPIVYGTRNGVSNYANFPRTGSRGLELEVLWTTPFVHVDASWAYANSEGRNEVDPYTTTTATDRLLGMPAHRVVMRASFFLDPHVTFTPSLTLRSERAAIVGADADGAALYEDLPASALLNGFLDVHDLIPGVTVGVGVRNLLDEDFRVPQPYDGYRAPLPFFDREWTLRLTGEIPM